MRRHSLLPLSLPVLDTPRRFYMDATGGNDANTGRSSGAAWQTIDQVNAYASFQPGDHILFKRGETWALTAPLTAPAHGLTFGAYGSGAAPILDGQDTVNGIDSNGKNNLRIENLEITQGLDFGITLNGGSVGCIIVNTDCHECGNDGLIFSDCSYCSVYGGKFYNSYVRLADGRHITGIEVKDGSHDILIDGVECYGNAGDATPTYGSGISIHNHSTPTVMPYNITVRNCNIHDEGVNCLGIRVINQADVAMTDRNIIIEGCTIVDNTSIALKVGISGAITNYVNGVTIKDNSFNGNLDQAMFINGDNIEVYRNLILSAYASTQSAINNSIGVDWYNNTHVNLSAVAFASLGLVGARVENVNIKNNIFYGGNDLNKMMSHGTGAGTTGVDIDYNLYNYTSTGSRWVWGGANKTWTTWLTDSGMDANSPARADPLFVGGADYTLQAGSPAIDAGVDVGLAYLGAAPDCGYAEKA